MADEISLDGTDFLSGNRYQGDGVFDAASSDSSLDNLGVPADGHDLDEPSSLWRRPNVSTDGESSTQIYPQRSAKLH